MREIYLGEIQIAILRGLIRKMNIGELISNLDLSFNQFWKVRLEILAQIKQKCVQGYIDEGEIRALVEKINNLESSLPSKKKPIADKTAYTLIQLLRSTWQYEYAVQFISHKRSHKRRIGYKLAGRNFGSDLEELLLENFRQNNDPLALIALVRGCQDITGIASFLLENLDEDWVQGQIFEKLILVDESQAISMSQDYPIAFAWGAARAGHKAAIPHIMQIIQLMEQRQDYEKFSLLVWALGNLEAKHELIRLGVEFQVTNELPALDFSSNINR